MLAFTNSWLLSVSSCPLEGKPTKSRNVMYHGISQLNYAELMHLRNVIDRIYIYAQYLLQSRVFLVLNILEWVYRYIYRR